MLKRVLLSRWAYVQWITFLGVDGRLSGGEMKRIEIAMLLAGGAFIHI